MYNQNIYLNYPKDVAKFKTDKAITSYPVDLSTLKSHLRLEQSDSTDDLYLASLNKVATQHIENLIGISFAPTNAVTKLTHYYGDFICIPEGNFLSVTKIETDSSVAISIKQIDQTTQDFIIELNDVVSDKNLFVTYKLGLDPSLGLFPDVIKQAIIIKVADLYDTDRTSYSYSSLKYNDVIESLVAPYKINYF